MNIYKKLITFTLLAYTTAAFAQTEYIYIADHTPVQPGQELTVPYTYPSPNYILDCHQDSFMSDLGSVTWMYKGVQYKGQIGHGRSIQVASVVDTDPFIMYMQTADSSGTLVFKNLDQDVQLEVTCAFILASDWNKNINR